MQVELGGRRKPGRAAQLRWLGDNAYLQVHDARLPLSGLLGQEPLNGPFLNGQFL